MERWVNYGSAAFPSHTCFANPALVTRGNSYCTIDRNSVMKCSSQKFPGLYLSKSFLPTWLLAVAAKARGSVLTTQSVVILCSRHEGLM